MDTHAHRWRIAERRDTIVELTRSGCDRDFSLFQKAPLGPGRVSYELGQPKGGFVMLRQDPNTGRFIESTDPTRECSVEGCQKLADRHRTICITHHNRLYRYGTYEAITKTDEQKLLSRVRKTDGCWIWVGAVNSGNGYGRINRTYAHRYAYELLVGPIPEGLQLDHLCRVPLCVYPAHLEPVTPRENIRRGIKGVLTTHCPQGHPYDEENTGKVKGRPAGRWCKACNRERSKHRHG